MADEKQHFNQRVNQEGPLIQIDLQALNEGKKIEGENSESENSEEDNVAVADRINISEVPLLGYINIRGRTDNAAFVSAVEGVLGGALPAANNTFVTHDNFTILWFGPDEWLVLTPSGQETKLINALRKAFGDLFAAATDVTGGYTAVDVSGSAAIDLLRKGSTIDFHPSVFGVGQCAQTLLGKTGVAIYHNSEAPNYRIVFRRSFADYLGLWLLDASREFIQA